MPFSPILGPEIPPFAPSDAPPPGRVWPFFNWALLGAWRGILWAIFWSVLVGSFEAISATMLGMLIDGLGQSEPALMWRDVGLIFSVFAFYYLIARPVVFGLNTAAASIASAPGKNTRAAAPARLQWPPASRASPSRASDGKWHAM